jgi:cellulose synthase/poly-beta-1,6-N-acetylglucosamine synthase-like glycosyltransferase
MGVVFQCLAVVLFVNRYIAGVLLRAWRGDRWDEVDAEHEPTVTVIVPMFNEGPAIVETLESLVAVRYPRHKLEIVCIDDCSTDNSLLHAQRVAAKSRGLVRVVRNPRNLGKRMSILHATRAANGDVVLTVDSDVVVDADAIRQLVWRFTDDRIAAVGGWVDVRNKHESWLARMQVVKYWYSYFLIKNLEWGFRRIMCLSGCLTAYRRQALLAIEPVLEQRTLMSLPINYGEDRYLTRQLIKAGYWTTMTLEARCKTTVPATLSQYFSQQLRWRRSSLIDFAGGMSHVWRLNPILAIHFSTIFVLLVVYPIVIIKTVLAAKLMPALVLHIQVIAVFGLYYRWRVRKLPPDQRVGALAILPLAVLMPLSYALQTPLALFSLDSASWETRNHQPELAAEAATTAADRATRKTGS